MRVYIDNGHGIETPGKRSPDGKIMEWKYARGIAREITAALRKERMDAVLLTPEDRDIPLQERVNRVNTYCALSASRNHAAILVSIHLNASGNGTRWMNANGWEAWTYRGQTDSDVLSECLYKAAGERGLKARKDMSDGDSDKEGNFYLLRHTLCPAVITENLFMDNLDDAEFLLSSQGRQDIVDLHVNGILDFCNNKYK